MKFSIIIPLKHINSYIRENLKNILLQSYNNYEVIILPNFNNPNGIKFSKNVRVIPTGKVSPGSKRNIGARKAIGKVLIFFDDDSFPDKNFFYLASRYFSNTKYLAIGGPAITPKSNTIDQKISGFFFEEKVFGGLPERYLPKKQKLVNDWPSVNFSIRYDPIH